MQLTLGLQRMRAMDWTALLNAAIRALGLASRFGLVIYIARYMGAADLGRFGLISGGVSMAPALLGWGLNYHVGRSLIGAERGDALSLLATRLTVTLISAGVAAVAFLSLNAGFDWFATEFGALVAAILILECLGLDIQMALINLGRNTLANVLLFVRSSAWAFVFCAAALLNGLHSLDGLLVAWLLGQVIALLIAIQVLRSWGRGSALELRWPAMKAAAAKARLVYASDIAQVSALYADRFVVGLFTTVETLGRYTLLWSIANAVFVLVQSAVLLPSLRRLVLALSQGGVSAWAQRLKTELVKGPALAIVVAGLIYVLAALGMQRVLGAEFHAGFLLVTLLLANVLKVGSDTLGYGLYSLGADGAHMTLNMAGAAVALALVAIGTSTWGIDGAGLAAVLAVLVLATARTFALRRAHAEQLQGKS